MGVMGVMLKNCAVDAPQLHPCGDALCLSWSIGGWVRRAGVVGGSGSRVDRVVGVALRARAVARAGWSSVGSA